MVDRIKIHLTKLVLLSIVLCGLIYLYWYSPARSLAQSRNSAISQLYFEEFAERTSWLDLYPDQATAHAVPRDPISKPKISIPSGYYDKPLEVGITSETGSENIFFTLDGSIPTRSSQRYTGPVEVSGSMTLRARVLRSGQTPGAIATENYIVGENLESPVLAITSDVTGLFDHYAGIYSNPYERGKAWHRRAVVTFISDDRGQAISFDANIKIHGNYTRKFAKKSLRILYESDAVPEVGLPEFMVPIPGEAEHEVVLRQGGDDHETRFRPMLFDSLYVELGGLTSPYLPVFVFINGEPSGIYNLREYIDSRFLKRRFGSGDFDLIVDGDRAKSGNVAAFDELINFLESHDLANDEYFNEAAKRIDVSNTLDYWLSNIYAASVDWPSWNTYVFRNSTGPDRRWRWISWDTDVTFNRYDSEIAHNTLAFAIRDELRDDLLWEYSEVEYDNHEHLEGTVIIRNLLQNDGFRSRFVARLVDLLNFHFRYEHVEHHLQSLIEIVGEDITRDWELWGLDRPKFLQEIEKLRHFARHRPTILREQLREQFGLGQSVTLKLSVVPQDSGTISLNTFTPKSFPWEGVYFEDMTVSLASEAATGYRFVGWSGDAASDADQLSWDMERDAEIIAIFEPHPQ